MRIAFVLGGYPVSSVEFWIFQVDLDIAATSFSTVIVLGGICLLFFYESFDDDDDQDGGGTMSPVYAPAYSNNPA